MTTTTFQDFTPPAVNAAWLNDVNDFVYGETARAVLVTGGTILNSPISGSTGAFTTLSTSGLATLNSLSTASATITGGAINNTPIGATTPSTGAFTTLSTTGNVTLGDAATDLHTVNGGVNITRVGVTSPVSTDGNVYSGTYTSSAATGTTNIDSVTLSAFTYARIGNTVIVGGQVGIDATAAAAFSFDLEVPVASNFSAATQLAGSGVNNSSSDPLRINANSANDKATFSGTASSTANRMFSFTFVYQVI